MPINREDPGLTILKYRWRRLSAADQWRIWWICWKAIAWKRVRELLKNP